MTREPKSSRLTDEQRRELCLILSIGCDRETASKHVGCRLDDRRREMADDAAFAVDVRRAEARTELQHMRNVQAAARDEKNWRASVWGVGRCAPERYGRRDAGAVTARHLEQFISDLATAVMEEVRAVADRRRLMARLKQMAESIQESDYTGNCPPTSPTGEELPPHLADMDPEGVNLADGSEPVGA